MSDTKIYMGVEAGDANLKVALVDATERRVLKTAVLDTEASPLDDVYAFESAVQNWLEYCQIESVEAVSVSIPAFDLKKSAHRGPSKGGRRNRTSFPGSYA